MQSIYFDKSIYLDNNSTTPLHPAVWEAMEPFWRDHPGNAASSHHFGRQARKAVEDAREQIASLLDADPDEVLFTSGATEANNLAIFGLCGTAAGSIVTSPIEHPCVSEPIAQLAKRGFHAVNLPVESDGAVNAFDSYPDDVRLVTMMLANHETGAIQPVQALAERLSGKAPFHCDAAAAVGKMPVAFHRLGVTSLTISAHKFHGPKGIGALLLRKNSRLRPSLFGGHQQQGKRPGTEPVPLVVGMAKALEVSTQNLAEWQANLQSLRGRFLAHLQQHAAPIVVNGPQSAGLPGTINVSFPGCRSDALLMSLDLAGVACSTGSACSSGSLLPSPVLAAMGISGAVLHSAMRFSFSPLQSADEIDVAAQRIAQCVNKLRRTGEEEI